MTRYAVFRLLENFENVQIYVEGIINNEINNCYEYEL